MIIPSTADFRAIVSAGGILGSDVTLKDVKAAKVIWGCSVLKMMSNTVRRISKKVVQIIIKVPTELIKLNRQIGLTFFCQQTHLLHDLQHGDMLLHGHSFGMP
jgi:hypothetical protein